MSDRDNITLPREVAYQVPLYELLESVPSDARLVIDDADGKGTRFIPVGRLCREAATILRAALAAEPTKPEPVASDDDEEFTREDVTTLLLEVMDWTYAQAHRNRPMTEAEQKVLNDIRTHLAAEPTKPSEVAELIENLMHHAYNDGVKQLKYRSSQTVEAEEALRTALAAETPKHPGYIIGSHWLETAYSRICAGEAEADVLRDCGWERVDDIKALRRDAERYREQKERSYRLQRLLKECVKVMQANAVFRDTKAHKDLKTRIRAELENKR